MQAFLEEITAFSLSNKIAGYSNKNVRFWSLKLSIFQVVTILLLGLGLNNVSKAQLDSSYDASKAVDGLTECAALYKVSTKSETNPASKATVQKRIDQFLTTAYVVAATANFSKDHHKTAYNSYIEKYEPYWLLSFFDTYQDRYPNVKGMELVHKVIIEKCNIFNNMVNYVASVAESADQ
jgi:hypothetical protein